MRLPPFFRIRPIRRVFGGALWRIVSVVILCCIVFAFGYALFKRVVLSPPVEPEVPAEQQRAASEKVIQLNILNASGSKGGARAATDYLRARGFDVVEYGNYDSLLEHSIVIDRLGDSTSSARVAYALGIPDSMRGRDIDSTLYLRCTVVIGKDLSLLKPFR